MLPGSCMDCFIARAYTNVLELVIYLLLTAFADTAVEMDCLIHSRFSFLFIYITFLPFSTENVEQSDAEKLRFYLRSQHNREMYWEEIKGLINRNPNLLTLYHQEMGKIHARTYGKRLREIGLTKRWFFYLFAGIFAAATPHYFIGYRGCPAIHSQ